MAPRPDGASAEAFVEQLWEDWAQGEVRPLRTYLEMFPGADAAVARAYLEHVGESVPAPPPTASETECVDRGDSPVLHGPSSHSPDSELGPYRLEEEIGRGGQGVVYRATDTRIDRPVALKVLKGLGPGASDLLTRFKREAQVASKVDHPGVCPVYDIQMESGVPYIAMRFIEGETLARRIVKTREEHAREGPTTVLQLDETGLDAQRDPDVPMPGPSDHQLRADILHVMRLIEKTARALHTVHEAGVIHRDMKPGNVMIRPDGEPVIMDFGLARDDDSELPTLTQSGDLFGTPAYMSPEQLTRQTVRLDRRTDVWSLGVMLYECITLRRPFEAPTREALFQTILVKDPPNPRSLNPSVPRDLAVVIETALEKDRDRRYQTALEMAEELRRIRDREPIRARPISLRTRAVRWAQRNPAVASLTVALFLAMGTGLVITLFLFADVASALDERNDALDRYQKAADPALARQLLADAELLWPRRVHKIQAMEFWLERAADLRSRMDRRMTDLARLRERALEPTSADAEEEKRLRLELYPDLFTPIGGSHRLVEDLQEQLKKATSARRRADIEEKIEGELLAREEQLQDPRYSMRLVYRFADAADEQLHRVLSELQRNHDRILEITRVVEHGLSVARTIRKTTLVDAKTAWDACRKDVAAADTYDELDLVPQLGLIPLGKDRESGLWEFWHVGSGDRPTWKGTATSQGSAEVDGKSGIILVLLPGGEFLMGAQSEDPKKPNYDRHARDTEGPPHTVRLAPFFIAKHEVTQSQWFRIMRRNPSSFAAGGAAKLGQRRHLITLEHPVERISWIDARTFAQRLELQLPTEAQWEYACRGGTRTTWWCGGDVESIDKQRAGNISDRTAGEDTNWEHSPEVDDGYLIHAPVGRFTPNRFGLHDTLGNVIEWCQDGNGSYDSPHREGDALREVLYPRVRIIRGGCFNFPATDARSAGRSWQPPGFAGSNIGMRVARAVTATPLLQR